MFSLTLLHVLHVFSVLLSTVITSLRKERASRSIHLGVYLAWVAFFFVSSSWCRVLNAACDCGTPWTFYLSFRNCNRQHDTHISCNWYVHVNDEKQHNRKTKLQNTRQTINWLQLSWCCSYLSRDMTKPTKWLCAQRRLTSAWASAQSDQSLRCPLNGSFLHADSEDSDQTGRMPRLIWVFAGRTLILLILSCRGSCCVALRFSLRGVSSLVLPCSHVLQSTAYKKVALWSPRLLFMHLFVYFICFSPDVMGWLRLMIVAFPELFI